MKIKKFLAVITALIIAMSLSSCTNRPEDNGKPTVSVTIAPLSEFVSRISGGTVNVNVVVPTGADPESYDPTINDVKALSDSEIYFTVGVPSEENSILPMADEKTGIVHLEDAVSEKIPDLYIGSERDPHIWLSADRAVIMAEKIRDVLAENYPENASLYEENAKEYIAEIEDSKFYAEDVLSGLKNRNIIVYHPAFGYFCAEHALTMHALESEGKEATAKELAALIDYAKENGIKTVFYQEESSGKQAKTFAQEIGGEAVMLSPLSENYIESYRLTADKIKESEK